MGLLPGAAGLRLPWLSAVRARFRPGAGLAARSGRQGHEPQGRGAAQGAVLVRDRGEGGAVGQAGAPGDRGGAGRGRRCARWAEAGSRRQRRCRLSGPGPAAGERPGGEGEMSEAVASVCAAAGFHFLLSG